MSQQITRILFLCMGNICRSPAAHCVLQHLVNQAGLADRFEIESAGTLNYHVGEAPDPRMQTSLRQRNIPIIGKARHLKQADLAHYDYILAMDLDNLAGAQQLDISGQFASKIQLFSTYCSKFTEREIPDPYYGGDRGFEHVLDLVEDGCQGLLSHIQSLENS